MKTYLIMVILWLLLPQCAPIHSITDKSKPSTSHYAKYVDLADVLRRDPGLLVSGSGRNVRIQSRRSLDADVLYVLNGMDVGYNYHDIYDLINMDQVISIRVSRNLAERTISGKSNSGGIIDIRTRQ